MGYTQIEMKARKEGENMRIDEKTYRRNKAYSAKTYDQIKIETRKENRLRERIEQAAQKHNISNTKYIIQAIENALQLDGITLDSLPPSPDQAESVKQD